MSAVRPELRPGLRFVEQVYRGEVSFVVKDPATSRYFRFRPGEARVLRCLDGTRTAAEVAEALAQDGLRISAGAVEAFARQLTAIGLIERSLAERSTLQLERLREERRRRRRPRLFRGEIMRMRWSLGDPDALFERTLPYLRWCFSRSFLVVSVLLFAAYFLILGTRWSEFTAAVASRFSVATFTPGSFAVLWVSLLVVAAVHELGHGYACKHFGGEVHEMGVMLLYLQPAMYCNVNDAWSFPELRARLWVTAAGGWIQFVAASLAALVWLVAAPGTFVADLAVASMIVGGAMTLVTNANPLLPLDGYFALSDYLGIPNLRLRAFEYVRWWLKRHALRLELPAPAVTERERRVFLLYGGLAIAYITLTLLIVLSLVLGWARQALGIAGFALVLGGVLLVRRRPLRHAWQTLAAALRGRRTAARDAAPMRRGRRLAPLAALLLVLAAPWPRTATGAFTAAPARLQVATAPWEGMVAEVLVDEGARVAGGAPLVRLASFGGARVLASTAGAVDSLAAGEARARARGLAAEGAVIAAERASEASQLAALRDGAAAATVRSTAPGMVLTARPGDLLGRHVTPGEALLSIGDPDSLEVRVAFAGGGATLVRPGQPVRLITDADAAHPLRATIASVAALTGRSPDATGGVEARVRLPAAGAWRVGVRGEAQAEVGRSTVLGAIVWAVRTRLRGDILL